MDPMIHKRRKKDRIFKKNRRRNIEQVTIRRRSKERIKYILIFWVNNDFLLAFKPFFQQTLYYKNGEFVLRISSKNNESRVSRAAVLTSGSK